MAKRKLIFVGFRIDGNRSLLRTESTPTESEYGDTYFAVMGPFKTIRAANFTIENGYGNPHIQSVRDAERITKQIAREAKVKSAIKSLLGDFTLTW